MSSRQRPSLLAFSALLLCTLHQAAGSGSSSASSSSSSSSSSTTTTTSPSEVSGSDNLSHNWPKQTTLNSSRESRPPPPPPPRLTEMPGHVNKFSFNTSRGNTVMSERSGGSGGASSLCAYRVMEGGVGGQLCFRHTLFGYKCQKGDCRTAVSFGKLLANILINGSVLLQWSPEDGGDAVAGRDIEAKGHGDGERLGAKTGESARSSPAPGGRRHRRGGFELSCWWNGSYTQFECAGVHLGSGCRDFLLTELHENIPYRICLRALDRHDPAQGAEHRDCVEFTLPPSGMQDIVIAMTTVGGAICVMLVIICLLVAYITENIMSPTTPHTYSYRTHSRH